MKQLTLKNIGALPYSVEEAMNRLRVNFGFCGTQNKKTVITSSVPGEGKSIVSANLWRLLAASGAKVVLVDADIRKSVLCSRYQISGAEKGGEKILGLCDYLDGRGDLDDVLYETNIPGAYLIPAAQTVKSPSVLLQSPRLDALLEQLAERFDYVLADTPSLADVADADQVAARCNGAILVVRCGTTPRKLVDGSIRQLKRDGCELMGVVLNRVSAKKDPGNYRRKNYSCCADGRGED